MKFWDSSAIIPLLAKDAHADDLCGLLKSDPIFVVWTMTPIECLAALHGHERHSGSLSQSDAKAFVNRLKQLQDTWIEVQQVEWVKKRAERLLSVHAMRADTAAQLAAALIACEDRPDDLPFVTLDTELGAAARREGFQVLGLEE